MGIHHIILTSFSVLFVGLPVGQGNDNISVPTKLVLSAPLKPVTENEQVDVRIQLSDAENKPAVAQHNLSIRIADGSGNSQIVVLPKGQSTAEVPVRPKSSGIVRITAEEPHLLSGGVLIRVNPPKRTAAIAPSHDTAMHVQAFQFTEAQFHVAVSSTSQPGLPPSAPSETLSSLAIPVIHIEADASRSLLADGKDGCLIYAMVENPPKDPIRLTLISVNGLLTQTSFVLSAAQDDFCGTARLTSTFPTEVSVDVRSSVPNIARRDGTPIRLKFVHPVHHITMAGSPKTISRFQSTQITVELWNESNVSTPTDDPLSLHLGIQNGNGELAPVGPFTISAGQAVSNAVTFVPYRSGIATLEASVPGLASATCEINVVFPRFVIAMSAIGGIAGGLIAYLTTANSSWWRIAIGPITGVVLYWAVQSGLLGLKLPAGIVGSAFTSFAISVIGGYGGTVILDYLLKLVQPSGKPTA